MKIDRFKAKKIICELHIRKHDNNKGEVYQDLYEINSNILASADEYIIPKNIGPAKDPERIRTTTMTGLIFFRG